MTRTIADRIVESAAHDFVGRVRELTMLSDAAIAEEPPFVVAFVHGPGGIGKSALVRHLLSDLPPHVRGVLLDARDVEPTPRGFCQALGVTLGLSGEPDPAVLAHTLASSPAVLIVDTYEVLGVLDSWLRTRFLPTLSASTLTVLSGRDRPTPVWHATVGWSGLVAEFPLEPLSDAESCDLLRIRGLDGESIGWASGFARGHPLALELAAATVRAQPRCTQRQATAPAGLLDAFLGQVPPATVTALEAAATVRRVTEPLLGAILGCSDPRPSFDALRRLPFTVQTEDGLLLHDVVRDTVGQDVALRDPVRRRTYRQRAVQHLNEQVGASAPSWGHTADLMYLIENPVVRDACFPSARPQHSVERARHADLAAIAQIAAAHETAAAAAILRAWSQRHPETFAVARGPDGSVVAFVQIAEMAALDPQLFTADPVAQRWLDHLHVHPPGRDDRVLFMRRWLAGDSGELRSPGVSACWLDVKRLYLQLRPRLRRIYSVIVDLPRLAPIFLPLGFTPVGEPIDLGGALHQPVWLDFGAGSVDGWLASLVGAETTTPAAQVVSVAGLSSREMEVLRLVAEGRSNREIGAQLFVSEKTAGRHLSNIFAKLGVRTRAAAARIAAEQGVTHQVALQHSGHRDDPIAR